MTGRSTTRPGPAPGPAPGDVRSAPPGDPDPPDAALGDAAAPSRSGLPAHRNLTPHGLLSVVFPSARCVVRKRPPPLHCYWPPRIRVRSLPRVLLADAGSKAAAPSQLLSAPPAGHAGSCGPAVSAAVRAPPAPCARLPVPELRSRPPGSRWALAGLARGWPVSLLRGEDPRGAKARGKPRIGLSQNRSWMTCWSLFKGESLARSWKPRYSVHTP